jgi:hypothetical protein
MKVSFLLFPLILSGYGVSSQSTDSAVVNANAARRSSYSSLNNSSVNNSLHSKKQKFLTIKGNITFTSGNLQLSPLENEISDLEALECNAMLTRDAGALKKVWARDFTLDEPVTEMVNDNDVLPYYASLSRMIENFSEIGDTAFTSGHELVQRIELNKKLEEPVRKEFFHTWTRKNGVWKLTTKTH